MVGQTTTVVSYRQWETTDRPTPGLYEGGQWWAKPPQLTVLKVGAALIHVDC